MVELKIISGAQLQPGQYRMKLVNLELQPGGNVLAYVEVVEALDGGRSE